MVRETIYHLDSRHNDMLAECLNTETFSDDLQAATVNESFTFLSMLRPFIAKWFARLFKVPGFLDGPSDDTVNEAALNKYRVDNLSFTAAVVMACLPREITHDELTTALGVFTSMLAAAKAARGEITAALARLGVSVEFTSSGIHTRGTPPKGSDLTAIISEILKADGFEGTLMQLAGRRPS